MKLCEMAAGEREATQVGTEGARLCPLQRGLRLKNIALEQLNHAECEQRLGGSFRAAPHTGKSGLCQRSRRREIALAFVVDQRAAQSRPDYGNVEIDFSLFWSFHTPPSLERYVRVHPYAAALGSRSTPARRAIR